MSQTPFVIHGEIAFTEKELRKVRKQENCYKLINKKWYKLVKKNGISQAERRLKEQIRDLRHRLKVIEDSKKDTTKGAVVCQETS